MVIIFAIYILIGIISMVVINEYENPILLGTIILLWPMIWFMFILLSMKDPE